MGQRIKDLSLEEFNNLLNECDLLQIPYNIKEQTWSIKLVTNGKTFRCKYSNDLNDVDPATVSKAFHKLTNYHYLDEDKNAKLYGYKLKIAPDGRRKVCWKIKTATALTYYDERYCRKWLKCYSYDINSAFSYAMLQKMPDTRQLPRLHDIVGENEIGFDIDGNAYIEVGTPAEYIFPLIESPFKDYIYKYYELKQNEKNKDKRKMWKLWLNIPTGVLQRHNIFLRNAVLMYSNRYIESFMNEDTVYCNTDSIVSLSKRTDLPLGSEIGLFKEEHKNENFKYIREGIYQWNDECHYKGINGRYIKDIEKTDGWFEKMYNNLPIKYNKETRRLEYIWQRDVEDQEK